jgi:hypothetical protein
VTTTIMRHAITVAKANGGVIEKKPGRHWEAGGVSFSSSTVEALVRAGIADVISPNKVKVREEHREVFA